MAAGKARRAICKKGNGKGKDKDKNKSKNGDDGKGKGRDNNWNSGQQAARFQGYCSHCAKWGSQVRRVQNTIGSAEMWGSCWSSSTEEEGEGVKSVHWSDAENDEVEIDASSWCLAAVTTPGGRPGTLLVDSGADDHICHPEFAKGLHRKMHRIDVAPDVQGNTLSHHGTLHVNLTVGTQGHASRHLGQHTQLGENS